MKILRFCRHYGFVGIMGGLYLGCSLYIFSLQNPLSQPEKLFFALTLMFVIYGVFLWLLGKKVIFKSYFASIIIISIAAQLVFLFMPAYFNDFFRYLWDGKMLLHGINPYQYFPYAVSDIESLSHLASVWYFDLMFFKWTHTIYPPTFQYVFFLANFIKEDSAFILTFLFFLFNIGSLFLGVKILELLKKPRAYIVYLALNPLFLFETLAGTHAEAILIFFLFLCIYFFLKKKPVLCGISFSFLVLTKFFPVLLFPFFLTVKHWWKFLIASFLTGIILYSPFLIDIEFPLLYESLTHFSQEWVQSPSIFILVQDFFSWFLSSEEAFLVSKKILSVSILALVFYLTFSKKQRDIFTKMALTISTLLLFSSVFFSWYCLWISCLIPFVRRKYALITLSYTILFQYLLLNYDSENATFKYFQNGEVLWNQLLIFLPFFFVLFLELKLFSHEQ